MFELAHIGLQELDQCISSQFQVRDITLVGLKSATVGSIYTREAGMATNDVSPSGELVIKHLLAYL